MEMPESVFHVLEPITLFVDGVGYAILIFSVIKFVPRYLAFEFQRLRGLECAQRFRDLRIELLSHILLAIDFMVISDVIHSGLVRSRDSLITLGIFVLIRSLLAFFVGLDLKEIREESEPAKTD